METETLKEYRGDDVVIKLCLCSSLCSSVVDDYTVIVEVIGGIPVLFTFPRLEEASGLFANMMAAEIG